MLPREKLRYIRRIQQHRFGTETSNWGLKHSIGALISSDNCCPMTVRPNRHHKKRFPVHRESVSHRREGEDGNVNYWGSPAVILILK